MRTDDGQQADLGKTRVDRGIVSAEHRALGNDGTMGSQSLQVFLCFADITISLLLSRSLIVVCDVVANAAFVSGHLFRLAPFV